MLTRLASLLAAILACLLLFEVFLGFADYAPWELRLYRPNPHGTGSFRLRPNLRLRRTFAGRHVTIQTNRRGMRWKEVDGASADRSRIAVVGDSFAFGLWADRVEGALVGVLDSLLNSGKFEVLNFGVPGYGFQDIALQIEEEVLPLRPRHIVLMFYGGNDFLDTYLGTGRYMASASGTLRLDQENLARKVPSEFLSERWSFRESVLEKARVFSLTRHVLKGLLPGGGRNLMRRPDGQVDRSYSSNIFWSSRRYPPFADAAVSLSLRTLEKILEVCSQNQIDLVIVSVPSVEQVHFPSLFEKGYDVGLPQKYIQEFAGRHGIAYLDLLEPFSDYVRQTGKDLYYLEDGHWNNEGHRVGGQWVASFLQQRRP